MFKIFITVLFSIWSISSFSQPPVKTPAVVPPTPTEPINMTNPQLETFLKDQNGEAGKDRNAELNQNAKINKDSSARDYNAVKFNDPKGTYGANAFRGAAGLSVNELSTPPPDYPIGVGDQIVISGYGGAEFQNKYNVVSDGSIFPNGMGKIYIGGLTFSNVQRMLYSRFSAVVPPGTNIDISLGQPRSINVNVVNEVNSPGIITISAFSNAFQVIARAGGITENGNLRNIQIKRNGRVIEELDIYKYLQTGDFGRHIYLQNNDFIIVPFYEKKVLATGQFKRPMYYQLRKDEGVKALLRYSGGLNADALSSTLKVIRTEDESQVVRDVNATAILKLPNQDELLQDGDIVRADIIRPGLINKVEIRGELKYPDFYELRKGDRLFDIINRAGGVTRNTYLQRAYIFRGAADSANTLSDKIEVDLSDINTNNINSVNNIVLLPNDIIQLFGSYEFTDQVFVEIFGEVRKEGKLRKYGGMTLQDLIYLSGGLKPSAEFGRLEISSIVDMDSARKGLKPTRTIVKSYSIDQNLGVDSAASLVLLKPYDQIFVRRNPTFELQQNVELKGLVKYPGYYPRLNKFETLSSYITRAGGFKENANLAGAVLFRRKVENLRENAIQQPRLDSTGNIIPGSVQSVDPNQPVTIDLYNAMRYKNTKYDIILQEQDMVFVPEINPFVTVQGRVQSPLKIAFDKEHTNVGYYIDRAGGFGVRPWRRRIYVTYANGRSRRTRNFMFFHFYPRVEEGSFVTIPRRPEGQEIPDFLKSAATTIAPIFITAILLRNIK
ncbi:MAG: SLBB domain-containing protein [Ferruginibacter sp.]